MSKVFTLCYKCVKIEVTLFVGDYMDIINFLNGYLSLATLTDVIDIAIVATFIYLILRKIRGTSAERLLKGVAVLLVVTLFSEILSLNTINYILENLTQVGLISLVVVFQPELRKILERMGKTKLYRTNHEELSEIEIIINQVVDATHRLSDAREGALIVFEKEDSLKEVIESGVIIKSEVKSELLRNVFYPKAPLHDGALVIKDGQINSVACILPLSKNQNISNDLGTRHRAAVGITETTDSICVIVSEETGAISISSKGMLKRHLTIDMLKKLLAYELIKKEDKKAKNTLYRRVDRLLTRFFDKNFDEEK